MLFTGTYSIPVLLSLQYMSSMFMSFCLVFQFASKSSNKQTSLQIIRHQQIAAVKSAGLSEDQTKGEEEIALCTEYVKCGRHGPNDTCIGLWIEQSGIECWPGSLCCVLAQEHNTMTLASARSQTT